MANKCVGDREEEKELEMKFQCKQRRLKYIFVRSVKETSLINLAGTGI